MDPPVIEPTPACSKFPSVLLRTKVQVILPSVTVPEVCVGPLAAEVPSSAALYTLPSTKTNVFLVYAVVPANAESAYDAFGTSKYSKAYLLSITLVLKSLVLALLPIVTLILSPSTNR